MLNSKFIYLRNMGAINPFMSMANGGGGGGGKGSDGGASAMAAQQAQQQAQLSKMAEDNAKLSADLKAQQAATQQFRPAEAGLDPIMQAESRKQAGAGNMRVASRTGTRGLRIDLGGDGGGGNNTGLNIT